MLPLLTSRAGPAEAQADKPPQENPGERSNATSASVTHADTGGCTPDDETADGGDDPDALEAPSGLKTQEDGMLMETADGDMEAAEHGEEESELQREAPDDGLTEAELDELRRMAAEAEDEWRLRMLSEQASK